MRARLRRIAPALALIAVAGLTAAPAASAAPLPEPRDPKIVPVSSIGGAELGDSLRSADRAWGGRGECSRSFCTYGGEGKKGSAFLSEAGGRDGIRSARIAAGQDRRGKPVFRGSLLDFRAKGKGDRRVGLGSTDEQVTRAFPEAKRSHDRLELSGKGRSQLVFEVGAGDRIVAIELSRRPKAD